LAEDKWHLLKDKGGASDLAFDGELSLQDEEAIDWNQVLKDLVGDAASPRTATRWTRGRSRRPGGRCPP